MLGLKCNIFSWGLPKGVKRGKSYIFLKICSALFTKAKIKKNCRNFTYLKITINDEIPSTALKATGSLKMIVMTILRKHGKMLMIQ